MRSRSEAAPSFVFVESLAITGADLAFGEEESRYLSRVVRARVGERATATDGRGGRAEVRLTAVGHSCSGQIERLEQVERGRELCLACGAPEGDRADWMIEKLAELGVATFQPLDCERGGWERALGRVGRWERLARAALRQSRACHSLSLLPARPLDEWLVSPLPEARLLADPEGTAASGSMGGKAMVIAIGPSGGFSPEEKKALQEKEFALLWLAGSRLRTETAALASAAWWSSSGAPAPRR